MNLTPNGQNSEWTELRMDWTQNGPNSEWTELRMDWTRNGLNPKGTQPWLDSTPTGTQPPNGLNPNWDSTPNGLNPEWTELRMGLSLEFLSTSNGTISPSEYKNCTVFFHHESLRSGQFRGQKGLGPLEKPREMPHYMFCPRKKNNIPDFLNQRCINSYIAIIYRDACENANKTCPTIKTELHATDCNPDHHYALIICMYV